MMTFPTPFNAAPGPSHIPDIIFDAMKHNTHHRTPEFEKIFLEIGSTLATFFGTKNTPLLLSGSGTFVMDAAVANTLSAGDKVVVLEFGKFSERFREIAEAYQCEVIVIPAEYGTYPQPLDLQKTLEAHPDTKAVLCCHNETSTGVLAPIADYAKIIAPTKALFLLDCISSLSSVAINQDENQIDVCLGVGHKGFMIPPGLAFVSLSGNKVQEAMRTSSIPKYYLDLKKEIASQVKGISAWTPNIHHIIALQKALEILNQKPVSQIFEDNQKVADYANNRLKNFGLKPVVGEGYLASPACIAYFVENAPAVIQSMSDKGIIIANGQGSLMNKIIRIGNMGYVNMEIMTWILDNLEASIKENQ
ncbi:MAG: pyridoxal-phosphate-dependent aminotransferase family protein [Brevinema sp.]